MGGDPGRGVRVVAVLWKGILGNNSFVRNPPLIYCLWQTYNWGAGVRVVIVLWEGILGAGEIEAHYELG